MLVIMYIYTAPLHNIEAYQKHSDLITQNHDNIISNNIISSASEYKDD